MNERLARVGDQLKDAVGKLNDTWKAMEAARKRRIIIIAAGLVLLAIALVIVLSVMNSRWVVLYEGMPQDETVRARAALEAVSIPARIQNGNLQVASKQQNAAMGQLAMQGIPSTTLGYEVFEKASGLTTTEMEKQEYNRMQWQDRLQDIIKTYEGVQNAHVNLHIDTTSTRAWDAKATRNTGAVSLTMRAGYTMSPTQIAGIRYLVGSSVGIDPSDVTVTDNTGALLAAAGDSADLTGARTSEFLQRMGFEDEIADRLEEKAWEQMLLVYPDPSLWVVTANAELDWDSMVTEIKEYFPLEGTNAGVLDEEDLQAATSPGGFTEGVVGETDNTDIPIYVDQDGDGQGDWVDFTRFRDFAVSYTLQQIEKDGATLADASIQVSVNDSAMDNQKRQQLREAIALATGLPIEKVGVQNFVVPIQPDPPPAVTWIQAMIESFGIPEMVIYIVIAALVGLVLILILVLVLRSKAKKKRKAAEEAAAQAELEEAERVQKEIEERKQQLKSAAIAEESDNAITNEVREFARNNPEITANLLRNWLKEEV